MSELDFRRDLDLWKRLGSRDRSPRWALAWKLES